MFMVRKSSDGICGLLLTKQKQSGLSLLEILTAVAIIGILILALLPAFSKIIANVCLRHTAVILARDIRYVQQQNMQDPESGWKLELRRYLTEQAIEQPAWAVSKFDKNLRVAQYTRILPTGITFRGADTFADHEICFTETGTPVNAGTVRLQNDHSCYAVSVMVFSGRIRWRKE